MSYRILRVSQMPISDWNSLLKASLGEGFRFLRRLEDEWASGQNQFSRPGEGLFQIRNANHELLGIGGINQDPYAMSQEIGRLRRFYILPSYRGHGLGKTLLTHILTSVQSDFSLVYLRTDQVRAAGFYESMGFERLTDHPSASHRMSLQQ